MIPKTDGVLLTTQIDARAPDTTYQVDWDRERVSGLIDGIEAVKQAIFLILSVERYEHIIFSWNYGVGLASLYGHPPSFVLPEIKRRITEALLRDDRVTGVDSFTFGIQGRVVRCNFVVRTVFGDVATGREVEF